MNVVTGYYRQWYVLQFIVNSPKGATIAELAAHFNVTTKTIRRDLLLLKSIPITFREELTRGMPKRIFYDYQDGLLSMNLNRDELLAFYVGRNLMKPLRGTYFWDAIQNGIQKIRKVLNPKVIEYAERVAPLFYQLDRTVYDYSPFREVIDVILVAMEDNQEVYIKYKSIQSERAKCYTIHPYSFVYHHGFIYIIGFSCKDNDIRFWKINRLFKASLKESKFERQKDFDIDTYLSRTFCPFIGNQKIIQATVRFNKTAAPGIQEMAWDSFKSMKQLKNGELEVIIETENSKPFLFWLLGYGTDVEIIGPDELREKYIEKLEEIINRYPANRVM